MKIIYTIKESGQWGPGVSPLSEKEMLKRFREHAKACKDKKQNDLRRISMDLHTENGEDTCAAVIFKGKKRYFLYDAVIGCVMLASQLTLKAIWDGIHAEKEA